MGIELNQAIRDMFAERENIKILATTDNEGNPHLVVKHSLHINDDGKIVYLEIIESSQTNKNLVSSIWFNRRVAINVLTKGKRSYQIKGTPIKAIIAGKTFEKYYSEVREKLGDIDLSTVWLIEPEEIREETFSIRREKEEKEHPLLRHLDRLTK
ncbi:pyridoxamine 5'-phosphate oxidase family protein [Desulfitobacterium sp. Sab5]|uniref:pyridoxamine 5'-phosphate oxidase family protein n=1 Tax=Desulfitobacterium nosdiversum TaxID=3375356 RepID=UPI003CF56802